VVATFTGILYVSCSVHLRPDASAVR